MRPLLRPVAVPATYAPPAPTAVDIDNFCVGEWLLWAVANLQPPVTTKKRPRAPLSTPKRAKKQKLTPVGAPAAPRTTADVNGDIYDLVTAIGANAADATQAMNLKALALELKDLVEPNFAAFATKYRDALGPLITTFGPYCAYCERRLVSNLQVEHLLPKNSRGFPWLAATWTNFLIACPVCNAKKSTTPSMATVASGLHTGARPLASGLASAAIAATALARMTYPQDAAASTLVNQLFVLAPEGTPQPLPDLRSAARDGRLVLANPPLATVQPTAGVAFQSAPPGTVWAQYGIDIGAFAAMMTEDEYKLMYLQNDYPALAPAQMAEPVSAAVFGPNRRWTRVFSIDEVNGNVRIAANGDASTVVAQLDNGCRVRLIKGQLNKAERERLRLPALGYRIARKIGNTYILRHEVQFGERNGRVFGLFDIPLGIGLTTPAGIGVALTAQMNQLMTTLSLSESVVGQVTEISRFYDRRGYWRVLTWMKAVESVRRLTAANNAVVAAMTAAISLRIPRDGLWSIWDDVLNTVFAPTVPIPNNGRLVPLRAVLRNAADFPGTRP